VCKLRPCLAFCHLYFGLSAGLAALTAAFLQRDPLTTFFTQDVGVYVFVQGALGCLFVL